MLGSRPAAAPSDVPALPEHMANQEFRFGLSGRNIDVVEELPLEIAAVGSPPGQKHRRPLKPQTSVFAAAMPGSSWGLLCLHYKADSPVRHGLVTEGMQDLSKYQTLSNLSSFLLRTMNLWVPGQTGSCAACCCSSLCIHDLTTSPSLVLFRYAEPGTVCRSATLMP